MHIYMHGKSRTDIPPIIQLLARPRHGEEGERIGKERPVHGLHQRENDDGDGANELRVGFAQTAAATALETARERGEGERCKRDRGREGVDIENIKRSSERDKSKTKASDISARVHE
jgi:hypothetical protein